MDIYRNDIEFVAFGDIKFGGVFTFEDCADNTYMKIDLEYKGINIVNLKDGGCGYCDGDEPVIKLNAKLIVE